MMPKIVALVVTVLLLSACQQLAERDERSPRSRLAVGDSLVLTEALQVPAGHTRVFLQHGKVVGKVRLRRYEPHCNFEVRSVSDGLFTIEPDHFVITGRLDDEVEIVRWEKPRHFAANVILADVDSMPQLNRMVRYSLLSERQPEVMYMSCYGGFDDAWAVRYPSIQQMREALGDWVKLKRAAPEPS